MARVWGSASDNGLKATVRSMVQLIFGDVTRFMQNCGLFVGTDQYILDGPTSAGWANMYAAVGAKTGSNTDPTTAYYSDSGNRNPLDSWYTDPPNFPDTWTKDSRAAYTYGQLR